MAATAGEGPTMTPREAIRVLMQSPFYFRLLLAERHALVRDFCTRYTAG